MTPPPSSFRAAPREPTTDNPSRYPARFEQAIDYARAISSDALLVIRHGRPLIELGDTGRRFMCHSLRKSFLSALYGFEVQRDPRVLALTLADLGIDDKLGLTAAEKEATVYHLLTARSGIYHPAGYETPWMRSIKPPRHSAAAGAAWCYNNWDFNALGTIYGQLTGQGIHAAFKAKIADPIGMRDFRFNDGGGDGELIHDPCSIHPAYPFRMSARDLARFGLLYLQRGLWEGRQVLARHWVDASLSPISHAGDLGAYGYMWWLAREGVAFPYAILPPGSFYAMGAGGHYCVGLPACDAIIVHRVDTDQPGRTADRYQIGNLLRLLLDALSLAEDKT